MEWGYSCFPEANLQRWLSWLIFPSPGCLWIPANVHRTHLGWKVFYLYVNIQENKKSTQHRLHLSSFSGLTRTHMVIPDHGVKFQIWNSDYRGLNQEATVKPAQHWLQGRGSLLYTSLFLNLRSTCSGWQRPGSRHDRTTPSARLSLVTAVHVATSVQLRALWLLGVSLIAVEMYL